MTDSHQSVKCHGTAHFTTLNRSCYSCHYFQLMCDWPWSRHFSRLGQIRHRSSKERLEAAGMRFLQARRPSCHRTDSVKAVGKNSLSHILDQDRQTAWSSNNELQPSIIIIIIISKIVHEEQKVRIRQKKGQNNQHVHKWHAMNDMFNDVQYFNYCNTVTTTRMWYITASCLEDISISYTLQVTTSC